MPIPPLVSLLQGAAAADVPAPPPMIDQGTVLAVYDGGLLVQQADGTIAEASQSTDEPLRAGDPVWISPTETTPVVHGSA
jgi:hypothetical protein